MLTIKNLLHQYRTGRTTVRRRLTELYRAASEAPAGIWISLIPEAQLEQYLARLERLSPDSLPLYGIPFAVKDNIDLAGIPTTAACPAYAYTPERSARVVELLVEAGAVPLGKTNMDQFATGHRHQLCHCSWISFHFAAPPLRSFFTDAGRNRKPRVFSNTRDIEKS